MDGQIDFLDRRIFERTVSKELLTNCQKKVVNGLFWTLLGALFGIFWDNSWQNRAFYLADRSFLCIRFFVCGRLTLIAQRINLADG